MTRLRLLPLFGVFALAAAPRIWVLVSAGGPVEAASYDQSVYYTAAVALLHGRFPYHGDFVLVHPPVVALVGTPFAALARLTDDATGFAAENIAFAAIGAVNAVLVVVVARAWGLDRGAVAAGLAYALWPVGFIAESTARLEPLGNFFFLLCLWAFGRGRRADTLPLVLGGVSLAVLVNVKLWWFAPMLVVLVLAAVIARQVRVIVVPVIAAALTALVLDLPFLVAAGPRMFRSLVTDQMNRPDQQWTAGGHFMRLSVGQRLEQLTGAPQAVAGLLGRPAALLETVVMLVITVAFVVTAVLACRHPVGRLFAAVIAVQAGVLLSAPVYYPFYGDFVAATAALVVAAAATEKRRRTRPQALVPWAWVVAAGLVGAFTLTGLRGPARPVEWEALRAGTARVQCLVADSPYVLIRLDALDRSFRPGCRNVVDFQGLSYGAGPEPRAKASLRTATPEYRQFVTRYLTSGEAVVLSNYYVRLRLGRAVVDQISQGPVLVRSGHVVVRWTNRPPSEGPSVR